MFPIIDVSGNVIAFGGRVTDGTLPKYLNSSDTPAFKKSRNLFALNFAKNACREAGRLILCEGYMDVIALHEAGFCEAVATLGTAITAEQARLMKHYTDHVVISYDADEAGQRAADKAFRLLGEAGVETTLLKVTGAKDPDEFLHKYGAERFRTLLGKSRTQFEFVMDGIAAKYSGEDTETKIKAAEEAASFLAGIYSDVSRELYTAKAAEKLSLPSQQLKRDVERIRRSHVAVRAGSEREARIRRAGGYGDRVNTDALTNRRAVSAEEAILGILLLYPEYMVSIQKGTLSLEAADFVTGFSRKVFETMMQLASQESAGGGSFDWSLLAEYFSTEEMDRISRMRTLRAGLTHNDENVLKDCIDTLKKTRVKGIEEILHDKRNGT